MANEHNLPACVIFHDATLAAIAQREMQRAQARDLFAKRVHEIVAQRHQVVECGVWGVNDLSGS